MCKQCIVSDYSPKDKEKPVKTFSVETVEEVIAFLQNQHECEKYDTIILHRYMQTRIITSGFEKVLHLYWVADKIRCVSPIHLNPEDGIPVESYSKSKNTLKSLHNHILTQRLNDNVAKAMNAYIMPKINVTQMTMNDDGSIQVTITTPPLGGEALAKGILAMRYAIQKALAEHEEDILNG